MLFGVAFCVVTPPLDAADERSHFERAYVISEGRLSPIGRAAGYEAWIPRQIRQLHAKAPSPHVHRVEELVARLDTKLEPDDRYLRRRHATNAYSPIAYAPAALAIWIGRRLELGIGGWFYQARMATLLSWVALTSLALHFLPIRSWTLTLLCLAPTSVFRASTVNADAVTNGASLLVVAILVRAAVGRKDRIGTREIGFLVGCCVALGLLKPGSWLLAALVALVPIRRFGSRARRAMTVGSALAASVLPSLLWAVWLALADPDLEAHKAVPYEQLRLVLGDPIAHIGRVFGGLADVGVVRQVQGYVGALVPALPASGAVGVTLPALFCVGWLLAALLIAALDSDPPLPSIGQRALLALVFVGSVIGVMSLLYLGGNPVGAPRIEGFQGRYYLPLAPLLALAMPAAPVRARLTTPRKAAIVAAVSIASLSFALGSIWRTLY